MNEQTGKFEKGFFSDFIANYCGKNRSEVKTKPSFGVDVSVVNLSDELDMAMASDPLSLIPQLGLKESAWLSVQLTANDIATTGFAPQFGQFVLNLPAGFPAKDFKDYWRYIHAFCEEMGMAITGGHTGFVEGQNSTIAGGATFITVAPKNQLLTSEMAQIGDRILVTKSCGISSSAILAMSFPETVKNKAGIENYQKAVDSFYEISVLKDALTAIQHRKYITAMHDVTEGGVLGAVYEMAYASEKGVLIDEDKLPVSEAMSAVCKIFSLDPKRSIGAGSLIICCRAEGVEKVIHSLKQQQIDCTEVGEITEKSSGNQLLSGQGKRELKYEPKDPYWAAFYKAFQSGWK
ncbi:MAG: AIR synthase family protein [Flavobacteriaceae bacterium]|nr:AIR synthase family protein [Flavobacteriaceae bacterium]